MRLFFIHVPIRFLEKREFYSAPDTSTNVLRVRIFYSVLIEAQIASKSIPSLTDASSNLQFLTIHSKIEIDFAYNI